ncbi:hypothetical protein M9H77_25685 [Catharanthus roseus]|uniref:Uncharacterized protein n=1 Tax=Catharanthus roseus TaxID=4058 RepID=A0ACC0A7J9_CATRO|nr:hypothetical protein M9H77_25685 [Catharanthus roseus]
MAFYGGNGDVGECYFTPYTTYNYDYSVENSNLIENGPYSYFDPNSTTTTTQQVPNYFVYNYSETRTIQYYPPPPSYASSSLFYSQTYYNISNPALEFNEPEFEEYDPTPYGGGYNITQTYGKPLPPSDSICYPRSTSQSNADQPDAFSYGSIPSPYGDNHIHSVKPQGDNGGKTINEGDNNVNTGVYQPIEVKGIDADEHPTSDDGFGYGYDLNKQVPYIPYGSGLETMDLCESIFGYWPCLAKMNRQSNANCEVCNERKQNEPWKSTADYLFGSPLVYDELKDDGSACGYYVYGK